MSEMSKVYRDGSGLSVPSTVMEQMGLRPMQSISQEQECRIMELTAAAFVADMDLLRVAGEEGIPDCSALKASLSRIASGKS